MKHRFPFFIREVIFFKIPACRCPSISNPIKKLDRKPYSGYRTERNASKSLRSISPRYDGRERLVVTDVKLSESGGEVYRVTGEEISVDTVQRVVDLHKV